VATRPIKIAIIGDSWSDGLTLKVWQMAALIDHMESEARRQKHAQKQARRR